MKASTMIFANTLALQYGSRLDSERLRRVVEAKTVDDAFKMLGDYGFSYVQGGTIDGFIVAETDRLIEFINDVADDSAAEALTAPYIYNNVKLAYKSRFVDIPADSYYTVDMDCGKIAHGDYADCPDALADVLCELDAEAENKPQNIDIAITRAMYAQALSCKTGLIRKYFRTEIDLTNILTAARMYRLGMKNRDEFIDGGKIGKDALFDAAEGKHFSSCFYGTPYEDMAQALEKSEFAALGAFEREADDYLYFMTDELCASMGSHKPFLNYYTQARIELKTLKTALVCVKTGAREAFYARRPEIYA